MSIDRLENKSLSNHRTSTAPPETYGKARRLIDVFTRTVSADGDDVATWILETAESAAGNEDGRTSEAPPNDSTVGSEVGPKGGVKLYSEQCSIYVSLAGFPSGRFLKFWIFKLKASDGNQEDLKNLKMSKVSSAARKKFQN